MAAPFPLAKTENLATRRVAIPRLGCRTVARRARQGEVRLRAEKNAGALPPLFFKIQGGA